MIAQKKTARGYFRSEKETSALSSSWKSLKPTCVVPSLHNSAVIELSVEGRSSHAFVAVIFLGSPVQNVSQSEACTCHFIYFFIHFFCLPFYWVNHCFLLCNGLPQWFEAFPHFWTRVSFLLAQFRLQHKILFC